MNASPSEPGDPHDPSEPGVTPPAVDWRRAGLRKTRQREVILGIVRSNCDHPTADWVYQKAREIIPDISLATVYRTLRTLKEKGLIHEFSGGPSPSRYDGTVHDHEHIRCVRCGVVVDVNVPEVAELLDLVAQRSEFRVSIFPLVFHGLCRACSAELVGSSGARPAAKAKPGADRPPAGRSTRRSPAGEDDLHDMDRQWVEKFWS
jgi:Fe2+ or Zn2+ uptake regulation protein